MAKLNTRNTTPVRDNRADAFINIDIVLDSGTANLVGAPLSMSKELQAQVIENADRFEDMQFVLSIHVVDKGKERKIKFVSTDEKLKDAIKLTEEVTA